MTGETTFILLFVVATTVAIAVRRLPVPYTVALVAAGLVLGWLHLFEAPELTKELLFTIFLPGLLFEAAFHIEVSDLWRNRLTLAALAVPGVMASTLLTTLLLTPVANALDFVQDFQWQHALVFGALISATDPIAVVALFRSLGAPKRLSVLMEGESLFNDGTAIVFFGLALELISGRTTGAVHLAVDFFEVAGFGAAVGAGIGLVISQIVRQVDDAMIEITLTTIAAYGAFATAEQLHYSGVIATVVAGLLCGNWGARTGMSPSTRVAAETFWEYIAFALNSIVFLLIGFEVHPEALLASWQAILVAYAAVTVGRGAVVLVGCGLLARTRERIPPAWSALLTWGGLRGGLPMVLALSLPRDFPHRELLVSMTFGVVILSILLQGLTMSPLLGWMGVARPGAERIRWATLRSRLQAADAAVQELERMGHTRAATPEVVSTLRREYDEAIQATEEQMRELHVERSDLRHEELRWTRRHLLLVEKNRVIDAFRQGTIGQAVYDHLLADIDARILALESGEPVEPDQEHEET